MPTIRSVRALLVVEPPKIKGSRFIASVAPVSDRPAAEAFVDARRAADPTATHHCFAYRLGRGENSFRFSDDGEPSGTAGRPILDQIDGRSLTDVALVVTRFFGGTKLGSGGLVRAYGGAAAAALEAAEVVETPWTETIRARFSYAFSGAVRGVLATFGLAATEADYGERVALVLAVPVEEVDRLRRALTDATAGAIRFGDPPGGDRAP